MKKFIMMVFLLASMFMSAQPILVESKTPESMCTIMSTGMSKDDACNKTREFIIETLDSVTKLSEFDYGTRTMIIVKTTIESMYKPIFRKEIQYTFSYTIVFYIRDNHIEIYPAYTIIYGKQNITKNQIKKILIKKMNQKKKRKQMKKTKQMKKMNPK